MSHIVPLFSEYIRLSDGIQVGIHKFVIDQNTPPESNEFTWNIKSALRGANIIGSKIALNEGQTSFNIEVTVTDPQTGRVTARVGLSQANLITMNNLGDSNPHMIYFATIHEASDVNSTFRLHLQ